MSVKVRGRPCKVGSFISPRSLRYKDRCGLFYSRAAELIRDCDKLGPVFEWDVGDGVWGGVSRLAYFRPV